MKNFFLFLFLAFLSLIFQFILTGWMGKWTGDLFFILVLLWSYYRGWKEGALVGFSCGIIKDIFFFPLMGVNAFSLCFVGVLTSELKSRIYQENAIFFFFVVGTLFLINGFLIACFLFIFHHFPFFYTLGGYLYPSFLFNIIAPCCIFLARETLKKKVISQF